MKKLKYWLNKNQDKLWIFWWIEIEDDTSISYYTWIMSKSLSHILFWTQFLDWVERSSGWLEDHKKNLVVLLKDAERVKYLEDNLL